MLIQHSHISRPGFNQALLTKKTSQNAHISRLETSQTSENFLKSDPTADTGAPVGELVALRMLWGGVKGAVAGAMNEAPFLVVAGNAIRGGFSVGHMTAVEQGVDNVFDNDLSRMLQNSFQKGILDTSGLGRMVTLPILGHAAGTALGAGVGYAKSAGISALSPVVSGMLGTSPWVSAIISGALVGATTETLIGI